MIRIIFTLAALGAVGFVYIRYVRPILHDLPHLKNAYEDADGFYETALVLARKYWDVIVAAGLIVLPEVPDLLQQAQLFDLSDFLPSNKAKNITAGLGIAQIVLRAFILKKTSE